jgi:RNA polymerase sigma-70 factor (ECF subfamily)
VQGSATDGDNSAMATDLLEMLARTSRSPRSVAGNQEYISMMREAIEELEPEHRVVLRLRFIEDLPHAQIALEIGRSEGAVRQICLRALRRLRGLLPAISANE